MRHDSLKLDRPAGARRAINGAAFSAWVEQFLPLYSPDLNPIEQVFAKPKALLRATRAHSFEALWSAIGSLMGRFSPDECQCYIRRAGYCQSG